MEKRKDYKECKFNAEAIKEAVQVFKDIATQKDKKTEFSTLKVEHNDSTWTYDNFTEFLADFRKYNNYVICGIESEDYNLKLRITFFEREVIVEAKAQKRSDIEAVFDVFEKNLEQSKLKPIAVNKSKEIKPIVFIGHGRNTSWRELKDHLQDKHYIQVEAYETGARAGHSIRDILEEMILKSSFALLVLTAEDKQDNGTYRARQNVIHEVGLFQGRLGFSRAIILLEEGIEEFTNVQGVQYISFSKNNIKEVFGEVLATIHREFYK